MISVASRFHRILKRMARVKDFSDSSSSEEEVILGVYFNENESFHDSVIITSKRLMYLSKESGNIVDVIYSQIKEVCIPETKEEKSVRINLKDDTCVEIPFASYSNGKFFDSYEMVRFLDRVIADIAESSAESSNESRTPT